MLWDINAKDKNFAPNNNKHSLTSFCSLYLPGCHFDYSFKVQGHDFIWPLSLVTSRRLD